MLVTKEDRLQYCSISSVERNIHKNLQKKICDFGEYLGLQMR